MVRKLTKSVTVDDVDGVDDDEEGEGEEKKKKDDILREEILTTPT